MFYRYASQSVLRAVFVCGLVFKTAGCGDAAKTFVVIDNQYAATPANASVIVRVAWQAVRVTDPIEPGASSSAQSTIAASANTAYVVLAPGWDPASGTAPASFVVLQSRSGFDVALNATLHIPVSDKTFDGNCAAGSHLSQAQTDFITNLVFPDLFASLRYDAATCTTAPMEDAGAD